MVDDTAPYDGVIEAPAGAPFARVGFSLEGDALTRLDLLPDSVALRPPCSVTARRVGEVLEHYWMDGRAVYDGPLALHGTPFQQRVWQALREIMPGSTVTYGELAARLGTSSRAVGGACRANPVPVLVPCHRVVAKAGLGGYSGDADGHQLDIKRWLLRHEGVRGA